MDWFYSTTEVTTRVVKVGTNDKIRGIKNLWVV